MLNLSLRMCLFLELNLDVPPVIIPKNSFDQG